MLFTILSVASEGNVVDKNELKKWGYISKALPGSYDYHNVNNLENEISVQYQLIRSLKHIKGYDDYYYYYLISEECFPNKLAAIKRNLAIPKDDKDFRLVKLVDNCVRIVDTNAKMDTLKEQPRIFKLFNDYMDRKAHNKSLNRISTNTVHPGWFNC